MFYVYQYLREDGSLYYIGKGSGNRAYAKRKYGYANPPNDESRIVIVKDNLTEGGDGSSGWICTEEIRKRMSEAATGKVNSEESNIKRSNTLKGIVRSEETKKKQSDSKKGKNNPMYGKVGPNKGKKMSSEQKKKISEKLSGRKQSDETKLKRSLALKEYYRKKKE